MNPHNQDVVTYVEEDLVAKMKREVAEEKQRRSQHAASKLLVEASRAIQEDIAMSNADIDANEHV